jgi:ribonuclease BN (tRNA processing enzyme)
MRVTFLGTGSPGPVLQRASPSLAVTIGDETILIDCGTRVVHRLLETRIDPSEIETVLFSHHHVDHNASFFEFALRGWILGREELTVYGPERTGELVTVLQELYEDEIAQRSELYDLRAEDMTGLDWVPLRDNRTTVIETADWDVEALSVPHSKAPTYAFRVNDHRAEASFVYSADTAKSPELAEFAQDADILLHEALLGPPASRPLNEDTVWDQYLEPLPDSALERLAETHSTATEAAEVAEMANVDTLFLFHMLTHRDLEAMRTEAAEVFSGDVFVAEDGTTLVV